MAELMSLEAFIFYIDRELLTFELPPDADSRLVEDLELDSLGRAELLFCVEELGVGLDSDAFQTCATLRSVYELYVQAHH